MSEAQRVMDDPEWAKKVREEAERTKREGEKS